MHHAGTLANLPASQYVGYSTHSTSNLWTATLQKGTRTVQVQAYSWEVGTGSGRVKLERAVFAFGDQLVVPLRQIAEALGMEVQGLW